MWCHPETIHRQQSVGQIDFGRCRKCEAIGNRRQVATRDAVQGGARAFAAQHWHAFGGFADAPSSQCRGNSGDWVNSLDICLTNGKLNAWTSVRVWACCNEVEQDNEDRESPRWSKAEADGRRTKVEARRHTDVVESCNAEGSFWSGPGAAAETKSSNKGSVDADARLCLSTTDESHWTKDGGGNWGRNEGTELHLECSQRAALGSAEHRATSSSKLRQSWQKKINLCKQCYNARWLNQGERQVTASKWRDRIKKSLNLSGTAVICVLKIHWCVEHTTWRIQAIGEMIWTYYYQMTDSMRRIFYVRVRISGVGLSRQVTEQEQTHCRCLPLEDYRWWVLSGHDDENKKEKKCCMFCAAYGGPTRLEDSEQSLLSYKDSTATAFITLSYLKLFFAVPEATEMFFLLLRLIRLNYLDERILPQRNDVDCKEKSHTLALCVDTIAHSRSDWILEFSKCSSHHKWS